MPDSPIVRRNGKLGVGLTSVEELSNMQSDNKHATVRASGQMMKQISNQANQKFTYNCTSCNTPLFNAKDIIQHQPL